MIPAKDTARDLVLSFYYALPNNGSTEGLNSTTARYQEGIRCALISVEQMIEYHNSLFDRGFKDVHIAMSSPIKTYIDILNPLLKYLQQVKQEINKL